MSSLSERSFYQAIEDPRYRFLKDFQCKRLFKTYADFIEQDRYQSACRFFFDRIYSSEDTHDRDEAFRSIYDVAKRFLGGDILESMHTLIELQTLTIELDQKVLEELEKLGAPVEFSMAEYEEAYRTSDNYDARLQQIEWLDFTMRLVHRISHRLGIGLVLKGLRAASLVVGDTRMVDFLYEGYQAFVDIPDIEPFAREMKDREIARLDRIYAGEPAPESETVP